MHLSIRKPAFGYGGPGHKTAELLPLGLTIFLIYKEIYSLGALMGLKKQGLTSGRLKSAAGRPVYDHCQNDEYSGADGETTNPGMGLKQ